MAINGSIIFRRSSTAGSRVNCSQNRKGKRQATIGSRRSFYDHAKGSTYEVIGILTLAQKRGLIADETYEAFYRDGDEIAAMLWGLMSAEQRNQKNRVEKG